MSGQASLFERGRAPAPIARRHEPTSQLAAKELTESGRRGQQKAAVLDALRQAGVAITSAELARRFGLDRYVVARRLPDLMADGLVAKRGVRTCDATGRRAIVWEAC